MPDPAPRLQPEPLDGPQAAHASTSAEDATVRRAPSIGTLTGSGSSASARRVEIVTGLPPAPRSAAAPLPRAGERIDVFELEQSIGVGGMGAVFRALDTRLDRHVALKILPPEQAHDVEIVQRFYQEGRAAARLDHENIARVFTIGYDGRVHFIAFEYIEGTTVRQRVEKGGPLPVGEAINFTLQIADALVHAAERGVVHRDIKPSNIIVTPHGRAKLVDMGLARRFERGVDDGLTQSGMTLGTFDYISPEQARDPRDVDVRSDLYSLGCTMFHMLTDRPPFPDGTVLQKLIQHQEEAPPDLRALNPAVPVDLSAIVVKLMAKDRDRRYQTPEQLVRDLLTVAGGMGLRSVSPEGLVWLPSEAPPGWGRSLVWGLPTLVFTAIVLCLVWWGPESSRTSPPEALTNLVGQPQSHSFPFPNPLPVRTSSAVSPRTASEANAATAVIPLSAAALDIAVEPGDDLSAALGRAPRNAVIRLGDGVHRLPVAGEERASLRLVNRDLTIRAEAGARPVLKPALDRAAGMRNPAVMLEIVGGRVTLEGLEFEQNEDDAGVQAPASALRAEDVELTIQRCVFRHAGESPVPGSRRPTTTPRAVAMDLNARGATAFGDRPPAVTLDRCHFGGGQAGLRTSGPVELIARDCTFSSDEPAVWVDQGASPRSAASATIKLRHISALAGIAPVFLIKGAETRIALDDSVVSATAGRKGDITLVAADHPEGLSWHGRGNLYAGVTTFLRPADGHGDPVRAPERWEESSESVREVGTIFVAQAVWADSDPSQTLVQESENPTRAFRLAADHPGENLVGTRGGPFGTLPPVARATVVASSSPTPASNPPNPLVVQGADDPAALVALRPLPTERGLTDSPRAASGSTPPPTPAPNSTADVPPATVPAANAVPEMPVMSTPPGSARDPSEDVDMLPMPARRPENTAGVAPTPAAPTSGRVNSAVSTNRNEPPVIRMPDQLLNALSEPSSRGGVLRVPAGVDWELSTATIQASGAWRVQAEPGATRPRLRFLPGPADAQGQPGWSALFALRSGALVLDGFDILLPRDSAPRQGNWAVCTLQPGTDLSLTNCTITIEGNQISSAMIAVESTIVEAVAEAAAVTVRLTDSLVRTGDDFLDVAGGCRLSLEIDDTTLATGGSIVHAHGVPRGETAERLGITFRQVTALASGGLIRLESTAAAPELPLADVNARYSIFATGEKDVPLIRVDGQDAPASTHDRVAWEGLAVAYHLLPVYRRDQSVQVGAMPNVFNQTSWTVAVGAREKDAFHGNAKFLRPPDHASPAWTLDKDAFRLDADSPARSSGADLMRIPDPPPLP